MKKFRKRYGDTKTNLILTDLAQEVYNETDPISIYERIDGLYDIEGFLEYEGMTADDVNELLESFSKEVLK